MKWTKKVVVTESVALPGTVTAVFERLRDVLIGSGRLVGSEAYEDGSCALRGVVGVGTGGLNPAVVTGTVRAAQDGGAVVELRAAGREGLIKQRPANKAIALVRDRLRAAPL